MGYADSWAESAEAMRAAMGRERRVYGTFLKGLVSQMVARREMRSPFLREAKDSEDVVKW